MLVPVLILLVLVVLVRVMSPTEQPMNLRESRWQMGDWDANNRQRADWQANNWPANNWQGSKRDNYVSGATSRLIKILAFLNLALAPLCLYLAGTLAASNR